MRRRSLRARGRPAGSSSSPSSSSSPLGLTLLYGTSCVVFAMAQPTPISDAAPAALVPIGGSNETAITHNALIADTQGNDVLGHSWDPLGLLETESQTFGFLLAPAWAPLGALWGRFVRLLGRLGALLGRLGAILGASWAVLGPSSGPLGPSWSVGKPKTRKPQNH